MKKSASKQLHDATIPVLGQSHGSRVNECIAAVPAKKVYILDDDNAVVNALTMLVQIMGWPVQAYTSSAVFLSSLQLEPPRGCLLLDYQMPDYDGLAVLNELNRRNIKLPAVMITAHSDDPQLIQTTPPGLVKIIAKPVNEDVLLASIQSLMAS